MDKNYSVCIGFLVILIAANYAPVTYSQIIGSSVVTSVSVILGKDDLPTTPAPPPPPSPKVRKTEPGKGVMNVIATLKHIVEEEQQKQAKHDNSYMMMDDQTSNPVQPVDESPPTTYDVTIVDEDDEDDLPTSATNDANTATDAINDFAKVVVNVQPVETDPAENDTATSAEVNDAIHQISGALIAADQYDDEKPIENIVTKVLQKINVARNVTQAPVPIPAPTTTTTAKPQTRRTVPPTQATRATTKAPMTQKPTARTTQATTQAPTTMRPKPTTTTATTLKFSMMDNEKMRDGMSPMQAAPQQQRPPVMVVTVDEGSNNDIPVSTTKVTVDDNQTTELEGDDADNKENDADRDHDQEVELTTLRPHIPRPTKTPLHYFHSKKPANSTSNSNRPTDFYDDEIFGYDPYQTFLHGVYVPVVEAGSGLPGEPSSGDASFDEEEHVVTTNRPNRLRQKPRPAIPFNHGRPVVKHAIPVNTVGLRPKPVPSLPDHLHRPRPSHIQYQHGAADDVDQTTGLLNVKYQHPGQSYTLDDETISPDKLLPVARPPLSPQARRNLTEHHDHHHQHQLGHVIPGHGGHGDGGHGHGGHGDGGHGNGGQHGSHGNGHGDSAHSHEGQGGIPGHGDHSNHGNGHGEHHNSGEHGHGDGHNDHNHGGGDHGHTSHEHHHGPQEKRPSFGPAPPGNPGLEATITNVDPEMRSFVDINNRLALRLFSSVTNPVSKSTTTYNNMVLSPFTVTSSLAMLFLGARGSTAAQLDGLLRLDDMLTFNPHMLYHNITQSFLSQPNTAAAMIRLLIADKSKGDVLEFYKTRVQHFYDARVEEADYKFAGHLAQSIINQMIRAQVQRHSYEMLNYSLPLNGPMSLLTSTFFDGVFSGARDQSIDSMNFIHLAALGPLGRRLFQVPAVAFKGSLRAAYDSDLDATAVEVPYSSRDLSLILMMPGRVGEFAIGGVSSLKSRLTLESWTSLMRSFYPREPFKVVFPRFRHQSSLNLSYTLQRFGLTDMFQPALAKFKGVNGLNDLSLDSNMMHFTEFGTWEKLSDTLTESNLQGNKNLDLIRILRPHVREHYGNYGEPLSVNDWIFMSRNPTQKRSKDEYETSSERAASSSDGKEEFFYSKSYTNPKSYTPMESYSKVRSSKTHFQPLNRQAKSKQFYFRQDPSSVAEEEKVLRFERPFLYVLRHNPTGMILMTGQYTEPVTEVLSK